MSRPDLQTMCDSLELRLSQMVSQHSQDSDFWNLFTHRAEEIEKQAVDQQDQVYVASRIEGMLAAHGLRRPPR